MQCIFLKIFTRIALLLKRFSIVLLLVLYLYTLYISLLFKLSRISLLLFVVGVVLNHWVISANNGKMPVIAIETVSYPIDDPLHILANESHKLLFFSDWIHLPDLVKSAPKIIASPGDILIYVFFYLWFISTAIVLIMIVIGIQCDKKKRDEDNKS